MPKLSIAPEVQPPRSHLLVLLAILVLVLSSSLYYYLRVTSPELFTNLRLPTYDLQATISSLRSTFRFSRPSPSPQNQAGPPSPAVAPQSEGVAYTLPSGPQTYRFSHGKDVKGPKVQVVTFDPLDPEVGSTQTITLEIDSPSPLKNAAITLTSDNQEKSLTLKKTGGDALQGTYQTSWVVDDTFELKYSVRYLLLSENDKFDNTMYIR